MKNYFWGIDVGSITVKVVILDEEGVLQAHRYRRSQGRPRQVLQRMVAELSTDFPLPQMAGLGFSGSGGGNVARILHCRHVNELVAQTRAVGEYYPRTRTVIEIGGQDSKFLSLRWDDEVAKMIMVDFAMNNLCAAGTGSFLDQQAERLGVAIENEFAEIALQSEKPARIAGRCTVFAKSDMIHLQQKGTSTADILAGLCLAMCRNYVSVIGKGKKFEPPILFQGGVAYNQAVVHAFEEVLKLDAGELQVPRHHELMAAMGTALLSRDHFQNGRSDPGFDFWGFADLSQKTSTGTTGMPVLYPNGWSPDTAIMPRDDRKTKQEIYLGIDVGSISTNVVAIDKHEAVLARIYLYTAGRPITAVQQGLQDVGEQLGDHHTVLGVGVTGSGRYLTGHYVGADVVRNEITAQARAALAFEPDVDTIFEIGGQDSKYISIHDGAIVDFAMNAACAAGTGSFLQEQADKLQIKIEHEFSRLAFESSAPACLGERCTVFMESDLVHHQQQGASVGDLTSGLAYSIAQNYLNRVVDGRHIGRTIVFQGGVAWNHSVVSAFQQLLQGTVMVPAHHDVSGAIGAAILAQEAHSRGEFTATNFKGFHLTERRYEAKLFTCRQCPNLCEVNRIDVAGERPIYFGARCEIFEEAGRGKSTEAGIPDLFAERESHLLGDYQPAAQAAGRQRVGIPRTLIFHDLFPYWQAFFDVLKMDIVLSNATGPRTMKRTVEIAAVEMCLPARLGYGHVTDLLEKDIDFLFMPSVVNRENIAPGQRHNVYCPFIQASPHLIQTYLQPEKQGVKWLNIPYFLQWKAAQKIVLRRLADQLGRPWRLLKKAAAAGEKAQELFYRRLRARGQQVLAELGSQETAVVLVGRPYNTADTGVCQDLPLKLRRFGVLPIPMDFLPLETVNISAFNNNMFWRSGQDILAAASLIRADPRLQAVYITNFGCGPDSFLLTFFNKLMAGKPFLELEVDDHTADAGVITRCEAFLESLRMGAGYSRSVSRSPKKREV